MRRHINAALRRNVDENLRRTNERADSGMSKQFKTAQFLLMQFYSIRILTARFEFTLASTAAQCQFQLSRTVLSQTELNSIYLNSMERLMITDML